MLTRKQAFDIAAHIWTDILKTRGDYDGWADDKAKVVEMILSHSKIKVSRKTRKAIATEIAIAVGRDHKNGEPCPTCYAHADRIIKELTAPEGSK